MFNYSAQDLKLLCDETLSSAQNLGATSAEIDVSESIGQDVQVRLGEVEQLEYQQDKSIDITVYVGKKKGQASSSDFSIKAIKNTLQAAIDIAKYTAEDEFSGLADKNLLAKEVKDLNLYHEWNLSSDEAIEMATECEAAALSYDTKITNSEGSNIHTGHYQYVYANSNQFLEYVKGSRHSISCSVVASNKNEMQRDYWYDVSRDYQTLESINNIGEIAAKKALKKLGARSISTGSYPIIFDAEVAIGLIGHLVSALSGGALYRSNSFMKNSLGSRVLPEFLSLREEPHIAGYLNSTYFDNEGVATNPRFVINEGIVEGYFLDSYSARKLGMKTTANSGGAHNLLLNHTCSAQTELIKKMGTGLLINELMGNGANILTGDYSRGAAGYWVENGVIAYPIHEITIAGKLQDMYKNIIAVANDSIKRPSHKIGSILINEMTVAGS